MTGREVLTKASDVQEAIEFLYGQERTYGWNMLLADAAGDLAVVEVDMVRQRRRRFNLRPTA